jgi:RND family efflux transporter MFP subunit
VFRKSKRLSAVVLLAIGVIASGWWYLSVRAQEQAKGGKTKPEQAVVVKSELAIKKDVPETLAVTGFVTPLETVDIRSQVVATIQSVNVKEGQTVRAGQSLFSLDNRGANADSDKLAAQLVRDQVALDDAQRTLTRNIELLAKNFVSQSVVDTAKSAVDAAQATLKADRAALTSGLVTVDYHRITAPISGRVGEIKVHIGSLVQPGSTDVMTTVTQMDPINVTFSIPERYASSLLAEQRSGALSVAVNAGGEKLDGKLSFIDNAIDSTAGSIKVRAVFSNPRAVLWPGALVDVTLALRTITGAIVVSPRSIQVGPSGQFVYVIGVDSKVTPKPVKIGYLTSDLAVINGLDEGSRVVSEGGQNLRPGLKVTEAQEPASSANKSSEKAAQ